MLAPRRKPPTNSAESRQYGIVGTDFQMPGMGPPSLDDVAMLVQYDITAASLHQLYGVPLNAVVTSAQILAPLDFFGTVSHPSLPLTIAQVTAPWTMNTATYNNLSTNYPHSYSLPVPGYTSTNYDVLWLFNNWASGSNYGALLLPDIGPEWFTMGFRWATHLSPNPNARPLLRLQYQWSSSGCNADAYEYDSYDPLANAPYCDADGTVYSYSICPAGDPDWRIFYRPPGVPGTWDCNITTGPGPNGAAGDVFTITAYVYPPPPDVNATPLAPPATGVYPELLLSGITQSTLFVEVKSTSEANAYEWSALGLTSTPSPNFTSAISSHALTLGDSLTINASLRNSGGLADNGGISVSVSGLACPAGVLGGVAASGTLSYAGPPASPAYYWPPDQIWSRHGNQMSADHVLIEGSAPNWPSGVTNDLALTLTPARTGDYVFMARGWLTSNGWGSTFTDPNSVDGSCAPDDRDQQAYCNETHQVRVMPDLPGGTTVIVHGFRALPTACDPQEWVHTMAAAIAQRADGSVLAYDPVSGAWQWITGTPDQTAEIVLIFNWCDESDRVLPGTNYTEAAGDALFAALQNAVLVGAPPQFNGVQLLANDRPLHLIGHSRGAVVVSKAWRRIVAYLPSKVVSHITMLDPHPAYLPGNPVDHQPLLWDLPAPGLQLYEYADNYFQRDDSGFWGQEIPGAEDRELPGLSHSDIHRWYHGTIDVHVTDDGTSDLPWSSNIDRDDWYDDCNGEVEGYFFAQAGGGWRPPGFLTGEAANPIDHLISNTFFNGDLSQGESGWVGHGGGGTGWIGGGILRLQGVYGRLSRRHNRLHVPSNMRILCFDVHVVSGGSGDQLSVYVGSSLVPLGPPVDVSAAASLPVTYDIPATLGGVSTTFDFRIEDSSGGTVHADVIIDNIVFSPWMDLGNGLAGTYGEPSLMGSGDLAPGEQVSLTVEGALGNADAIFVVGFSAIYAPARGGVLVPALDAIIAGLRTDAAGEYVLSFTVPPTVPSGLTLYCQSWVVDGAGPRGYSASNAVSGMTR